ncbi:hypothetical protein GIB67_033015 [Kingdonia uniflora]|uniref:Glycosyltransferase n=1 Tax=Kingdonia uniflora TaxID=39325 RepID=A0A7J7MYC6_9MAGN|nr:hypothetical protein GIB67_033015 [Kingdonia uniflora]
MASERNAKLHVAMYPWFALGHLTPYIRLANKLGRRGHRVSFLLPLKTQSKLQHLNLHPQLIQFIPITVPHVDGLPPGAETTHDIPFSSVSLLIMAMDNTQKDVELLFMNLKPDIVFFDFTHWMPSLATRLNIKSVDYVIINPASVAYLLVPSRKQEKSNTELMKQPEGFPPSTLKLLLHEAQRTLAHNNTQFGEGVTFHERITISMEECDTMAFRSCREIEAPFCDYIETQYKKPLLLTGPVLPDPPTSQLEDRWVKWLKKFSIGSVVYCSFGSECVLTKDKFEELLLGFELSELPFLVALKPPIGADTIEAALPTGFKERVEGRGVVDGGWMQQQLILGHPSVGCFVTHCGSGSLSEALVNKCQLVLLPHFGDQYLNARMMAGDLKVGVEVEKREEDGWFGKESVCKAVKLVMDEESEIGREVRKNHTKFREILLGEGLESSYIDSFIQKLQDLVDN